MKNKILFVFVVLSLIYLSTNALKIQHKIGDRRRGVLEKRVAETAFGRELLTTVRSQLASGEQSFSSVQDFLYQVYKKIVNDQADESAAHATRISTCESSLSQLLNVTREKAIQLTNLTSLLKENEALDTTLNKNLTDIRANVGKMQADLATALRRMNNVQRERDGSHNLYEKKFDEAKTIADEIQKIVNKLNLMYPSQDKSQVNSQAARFFEKFGSKSDNHLSSFVAVAEEIYSTATVDNVRRLFMLQYEELRQYMDSLNAGHTALLADLNRRLNAATNNKNTAQTTLTTSLASLDTMSARSKVARYQIAQLRAQQTLGQSVWTNVKDQLNAQAAYCKDQTEQDIQQARHRVEQLKTLAALRQLINEEIQSQRKALIDQAQREAAAREETFKDSQRRIQQLRATYQQLTNVSNTSGIAPPSTVGQQTTTTAASTQQTAQPPQQALTPPTQTQIPTQTTTTQTTTTAPATTTTATTTQQTAPVQVPTQTTTTPATTQTTTTTTTPPPQTQTPTQLQTPTQTTTAPTQTTTTPQAPQSTSQITAVPQQQQVRAAASLQGITSSLSAATSQQVRPEFQTPVAHTCLDVLNQHRNQSSDALKSGVFTIFSRRSLRPLTVYCDMETDGGGWMLAYKQFKFSSGSVAYNFSLSNNPIMTTATFKGMKAGDTTPGSLLQYGHPSEILFKSRFENNWFITQALNRFQRWNTSRSSRYCMYRPLRPIKISDKWDNSKGALWPDTSIQLMISPHPSISAITIGRFASRQRPPQCVAPQCSSDRHGRYNGVCQNNSKGIGSWMLFVR